jgi:hypothetical protein
VLRLLGSRFVAMPRVVAGVAVFLGAGVIAFAFVVPTLGTATDDEPASHDDPRVTLAPLASDGAAASDNAARPPEGVNGVVRSAGGGGVSGARVDLVPLFSDAGVKRLSATTDGSGRFVFDGVDVTPGSPYVADVRFEGATFPSDVLRFGTTAEDPLVIRVAPPTKRTSGLRFDVESVAIVGDAKGAQVVHALTVRNTSTRAYVGELRLPIIAGGNAIDPRAGLDRRMLDLRNGELVSRTPIVPGRHDITYTYVAPMPSDGLDVRRRTVYPTRRFELLVGGDLTAARVGRPTPAKIVTIGPQGQERTYIRIEIGDLEPRESLRFIVSVKRGSSALRSVGLVAAALAAVAIVAYPLVRRRRRAKLPPSPREPVAVE